MTVQELIEILQSHDQDMEVQISYTSADYWRTIVSEGIDTVEEGEVEYSDYHQKDRVIDEDDEEDQTDPRTVLLLSS